MTNTLLITVRIEKSKLSTLVECLDGNGIAYSITKIEHEGENNEIQS